MPCCGVYRRLFSQGECGGYMILYREIQGGQVIYGGRKDEGKQITKKWNRKCYQCLRVILMLVFSVKIKGQGVKDAEI